MSKEKWKEGVAPLGLYFSFLTKHFAGAMVQKLSHIDLDKYFRILVVLEQADATFTQQNLSDHFKTNKASVVRIVDHLAKKGYVRRRVNNKDRREHLLILTEKAKNELPAIKEALCELEKNAFKGFTDEQKQIFFQLLDQIYVNMSDLPVEEAAIKYGKITPSATSKRKKRLLVQVENQ
ncbi:MarR family transcriptional regulator [Rhodocytophaga rosea]|uniref:MarR family transcriptional regulator n=1 Tax=Rhodocytophaga rosea TaxID=2704465 RepID=A0A6C0GMP0_9BACT|nr:MarR family transcriptional regulator [Rhodocytophaga rosea]QHT69306.1 MarR family transcriptional regulator [Rhodocytophaga rosea]